MSSSYNYPATAPQQPVKKAVGLSVAALVVGIVAFLVGLIPVLGAIVGLTAVVLGVVALNKRQPKGMPLTGVILGSVAVLASIGMLIGVVVAADKTAAGSPEVSISETESLPPVKALAPAVEAPAPAPAPAAPAVPVEYTSALSQAGSYAKTMHMSKVGVFDQLTSEYGGQFTVEAAQYAVDNVEADWMANAAASGKSYQKMMSMSPAAIHDQLTSEYGGKFTVEEADYAVLHLND